MARGAPSAGGWKNERKRDEGVVWFLVFLLGHADTQRQHVNLKIMLSATCFGSV